MKEVSGVPNSAAICCIWESVSSLASGITVNGFPAKASSVNTSTCRIAISLIHYSHPLSADVGDEYLHPDSNDCYSFSS